jgi:GMP synthase (glutamine-hydrolysing)
VPVLGICYGMQTMAAQLGGKVESSGKREFGYAEIRARGHSSCWKASRTAPTTPAMACSMCG